MNERRVSFVLSLSLFLTTEQTKQAVSILRGIVQSKERVRYDRIHLMSIGRTSRDFEVVYFALTDDYNIHMDIQQEILLEISTAFDKEGFKFAYPVQTLQHLPADIHLFQEMRGENADKVQSKTLS